MQDILSQIVADKQIEIAETIRRIPEAELHARLRDCDTAKQRSMSASLAASQSGIIAEFKRKSPSKGWIHKDASPIDVMPHYIAAGASALSILTDFKYFGGTLSFIKKMRPLVDIPILRKDFIISDYQLMEAKLAGADAVLLIAACLSLSQYGDLLGKAHELGLEVLLETHSPEELAYFTPDVDMLGVNNRNLGSFHTDVANSFRMASAIAAAGIAARSTATAAQSASCGPVLVSESGISKAETVRELRKAGFRGFLMGEYFMKHSAPAEALKDYIAALQTEQ